MNIEQYKQEFDDKLSDVNLDDRVDVKGWVMSRNTINEIWNWLQKALKENTKKWYEAGYDIGYLEGTEKAVKEMLVEERCEHEFNSFEGVCNKKGCDVNRTQALIDNGFNQCCALQRERKEKILKKLC